MRYRVVEYSGALYWISPPSCATATAVAVGQALVQAKQAYLANTPVMRACTRNPCWGDAVGTADVQFDLPMHIPEPVDASIVHSTSPVTTNRAGASAAVR